MRWYGKLLGLVAGYLLLKHPGGALIGLLLGHAFDADWFRPRRDDPYAVLGLRDDAPDGEVERAYRRLIAQYHAEDKARAINAAYERIRRERSR